MSIPPGAHLDPKDVPPSIGFLVNRALFGMGSELYRVHRPAQVLNKFLGFWCFVAVKFDPSSEKGQPWYLEVEGQAICPQVIVLRQTTVTEERDDDDYSQTDFGESFEKMRRFVEWGQAAGQIFLLDLDDHPYAWNALAATGEDDRITDEQWQAFDAYVQQFNAVLCSTKYLQVNIMGKRLPGQSFYYAPNLYDPWRYHPERARFGKTLGAHIYVKARDQADFDVLGPALRPVLDGSFGTEFLHVGEEYPCRTCTHPQHKHFEGLECDECRCEKFEFSGSSLARVTGWDEAWIRTEPACSPWDLPDHITWNVGVVPLAHSEWNYAKTEGKGFEMAAAGVPFVALTSGHPLYKKSPGNLLAGFSLVKNEDYWRAEHFKARKWAEQIAKEHQIEYLATLRALSRSNLHK